MPDLNALLSGVPFVVVGGTATSLYMPARTTNDVDILVSSSRSKDAQNALRTCGASMTGRLTIGGTTWKLPDGSELDVLESDEPWVSEALSTPNRDAAGLPIVALPFLVMLKLRASRSIDIGDLGRMLGGASEEALAEVREVIRRYLPDAVDDLESLIQLGRLEYQASETSHEECPDDSAPA